MYLCSDLSFFNLASMKQIFVCSLAFLLGSSGTMAQSVSDRVELNEKESVGMTLSRFSPVKPKSEDANALLVIRCCVCCDKTNQPSQAFPMRSVRSRSARPSTQPPTKWATSCVLQQGVSFGETSLTAMRGNPTTTEESTLSTPVLGH